MQSQMQLKKAVKVGASSNSGLAFAGNNKFKSGLPVLAPVIDLKSKSSNSASSNTPDSFNAIKRGSKRDRTVSKLQQSLHYKMMGYCVRIPLFLSMSIFITSFHIRDQRYLISPVVCYRLMIQIGLHRTNMTLCGQTIIIK